jgi:CheY-like chemotaxis protein
LAPHDKIPATEEWLMATEPEQDGPDVNGRLVGILVADDMALILTLLKFELEARGFNCWLAVDGDDALDLYRKHRDQIDLVLLDVHMPGLDGPKTLEALQRLNPDVIACFMSDGTGHYTDEELFRRGAAWIFSKPFRPAEVADLLQRVAGAQPIRVQPKPINEGVSYARPASISDGLGFN